MQDRPTAAELVTAVREWIEREVMPSAEGRVAFHARVAANALGIVERELTLDAALTDGQRERARSLVDGDGTAVDLERELAARIRDGSLDDRIDEVRAHVRRTVREKLLVANPGYLPDGTGP
ncbi:MAG: hypothetical protein KatS3mg010_0477 [Acidimicrobiia bacterium]|nr:MAG: hypothetical protein KatS3mg010_0477 [Acidimicrobiia bacterium]